MISKYMRRLRLPAELAALRQRHRPRCVNDTDVFSATAGCGLPRDESHDVPEWTGFDLLRDARELRKVTFAAQMLAGDPLFPS